MRVTLGSLWCTLALLCGNFGVVLGCMQVNLGHFRPLSNHIGCVRVRFRKTKLFVEFRPWGSSKCRCRGVALVHMNSGLEVAQSAGVGGSSRSHELRVWGSSKCRCRGSSRSHELRPWASSKCRCRGVALVHMSSGLGVAPSAGVGGSSRSHELRPWGSSKCWCRGVALVHMSSGRSSVWIG